MPFPYSLPAPVGSEVGAPGLESESSLAVLDWRVEDGHVVLDARGGVDVARADLAGVAQLARQTVLLQHKEYYLDESQGIPWLPDPDTGADGLLGAKPFDEVLCRDLLRADLVGVPHAVEVPQVTVEQDPATRSAQVSFTLFTDFGELSSGVVVNG